MFSSSAARETDTAPRGSDTVCLHTGGQRHQQTATHRQAGDGTGAPVQAATTGAHRGLRRRSYLQGQPSPGPRHTGPALFAKRTLKISETTLLVVSLETYRGIKSIVSSQFSRWFQMERERMRGWETRNLGHPNSATTWLYLQKQAICIALCASVLLPIKWVLSCLSSLFPGWWWGLFIRLQ